jgi:hypothetical protein
MGTFLVFWKTGTRLDLYFRELQPFLGAHEKCQ